MTDAAEDEDDDLCRECLQRQLDELDSLELIFPKSSSDHHQQQQQDITIDAAPRAAMMLALSTTTQDTITSFSSLAPITLSVGRSPCLGITLPRLYPEAGHLPLLRWKEGAQRSEAEKKKDMQRLRQLCASYDGVEHLLPLVQEFLGLLEEQEKCAGAAAAKEEAPTTAITAPILGRRLIYFHHIINKTKREIVMKEAIANELCGFSKIGWPGVVVVEGEITNVQAYVRHLFSLRWQEIKVRGEEQVACKEGETIDSLRRLPRGFEELGEHQMSVLASHMREAGLEDLFRTLMK